MKKTLIAISVAITLSGCGTESDYDHSARFQAVEDCTGLTTKYDPDITIVPVRDWKYVTAGYFQSPSSIFIQQTRDADKNLIEHEMVHYLLYDNYGDLNPDHTNPLFERCAPGAN